MLTLRQKYPTELHQLSRLGRVWIFFGKKRNAAPETKLQSTMQSFNQNFSIPWKQLRSGSPFTIRIFSVERFAKDSRHDYDLHQLCKHKWGGFQKSKLAHCSEPFSNQNCTTSGHCDPSSHRTCSENFETRQSSPMRMVSFKKDTARTCWGIVSTGRQTQETMDAKHLDYDMAQNAWWPRWFQQLQRTTCSNTASNYQQRNVATFPTRLYPGHRSYVELIYSSASRSSCTEGQRCCGEPTGMAPAFLS